MNAPVVKLPSMLDGPELAQVIHRLLKSCPTGLPSQIEIDFGPLGFIAPAGVTFLSNLVHWLNQRGCQPHFINLDHRSRPIKFLDNSLFFEQHTGSKLSPLAAPRETTIPLKRVTQAESHAWLRSRLTPWLASRLKLSEHSLHQFQVCVSEVLNNISDHTPVSLGSMFVQHYPGSKIVKIAVADFGPGIPEVVRKAIPNLSDVEAIKAAVQNGFTTRSTPRNRGAGLDFLLQTVVGANGGAVTIFSQGSYVAFRPHGVGIVPVAFPDAGFCPGTTIDIMLRTDTIEEVKEGNEDLQW